MIESEKPRFAAIVTGLAEYYQRPMSPVILGLYWEGLKRFDLAAIEEAAGRHISQGDAGQFMPKVADIAKLIEGSGSDSALMAWAKVVKAVRSVGTYQSVVFDDPVIHAAIADMGGWMQLGMIDEDHEMPFKEKEFVAKYRAYRNRTDLSYPPKLLGRFDAENGPKGFDAQPVAMIGDARAAQRVLENGNKGGWLQVAYVQGEGLKSLPRAA